MLFAVSVRAQTPIDANHNAPAGPPIIVPATQGTGSPGSSLLPAWVDVFDRPDSTNMGPDWTEATGDQAIFSNHGQGNMATGWSYMLHNSAALAPADVRMEIDLLPPAGSSGPHVALIAGAAPGATNWFYTKLQDNNSDGTYDRIFFYRSGNGTGWGTNTFVDIVPPVASGRVYMYFTNAGDTMHVDIDSDQDGIVDQAFSNSGALAVSVAGNGFGIGTWGMGAYDFWLVIDTTQASMQTYGNGCAGTGGAVPAISGGSLPQLGNLNFSIDVQNGLASSIAVLVAGFGPASIPVGSCTALVAPPWATAALLLDGSGAGGFTLPIPNAPSLIGAVLAAQYLVVDGNGAFQGFAALSNGLQLTLGH